MASLVISEEMDQSSNSSSANDAENANGGGPMDGLPVEMTHQILSFCHIKDVINATYVNKKWQSAVSHELGSRQTLGLRSFLGIPFANTVHLTPAPELDTIIAPYTELIRLPKILLLMTNLKKLVFTIRPADYAAKKHISRFGELLGNNASTLESLSISWMDMPIGSVVFRQLRVVLQALGSGSRSLLSYSSDPLRCGPEVSRHAFKSAERQSSTANLQN